MITHAVPLEPARTGKPPLAPESVLRKMSVEPVIVFSTEAWRGPRPASGSTRITPGVCPLYYLPSMSRARS